MRSCGHDSAAFDDDRCDLTAALVRCRWHGDDRLSLRCERGSVDEVHLTAHSRVELCSDRVCADLSGEVDLDCRVDCCHLRVLCNHERVVCISHIHHGHHRVVIDEVIHLLGSHEEGGNELAFVCHLVGAVDDSLFHELQHSVREHLCVHSEVLMASELGENCVRNGSDAHLETCSVVDKGCAMLSDGDLHLVRLTEMCRFERLVAFHEYVDHVEWNHRLTPCARHIRVNHGDDGLRTFDGSEGRIDRGSE